MDQYLQNLRQQANSYSASSAGTASSRAQRGPSTPAETATGECITIRFNSQQTGSTTTAGFLPLYPPRSRQQAGESEYVWSVGITREGGRSVADDKQKIPLSFAIEEWLEPADQGRRDTLNYLIEIDLQKSFATGQRDFDHTAQNERGQ
ncbi:hypothetical protein I350_07854 [Cryptococcus amylolentus CBS 6273]|uniref:Uncharacterized protein n=1 Tax=Cryptococcus amylolentus CBS 6273 TaxID=1296118 RepID=A0A1E3JBF5_9TREE|nr:hypothetical protein I350_07854 [Cryptococcus amylolentus CBS 6273]